MLSFKRETISLLSQLSAFLIVELLGIEPRLSGLQADALTTFARVPVVRVEGLEPVFPRLKA